LGQKVHPYGFRLGYINTWRSRWYADKNYGDLLHEDLQIKKNLKRQFYHAGISSIEIERMAANKLTVIVRTARPGIIIGRKGSEIDRLKSDLQAATGREVYINIQEEQKPETDAQLVAEGLHPLMAVQLTHVSVERICFWAEGEEHVLAPIVAANVSVVPLPREQPVEESLETLAALEPGEEATVVGLSPNCRGLERRRLMDLGLLPGTVVAAEMKSPVGDPTAFRIRGALIALRGEQAANIRINSRRQVA